MTPFLSIISSRSPIQAIFRSRSSFGKVTPFCARPPITSNLLKSSEIQLVHTVLLLHFPRQTSVLSIVAQTGRAYTEEGNQEVHGVYLSNRRAWHSV